ncbi:MAG TPA: hypothetical protein VF796_12200, partial [Humisphaera sp.]
MYGPAGLVVRLSADGTRHYAHADRSGSVAVVADATGQAVERYIYTPAGVAKAVGPNPGMVLQPVDLTQAAVRWSHLWLGRRMNLGDRLYNTDGRPYDPFTGQAKHWSSPYLDNG